jgi:hypothetical protein
MRDFITTKIIKDRSEFMERDGGKDYARYSNKDVTLEKLKEFKQIEGMYKKFYNPKILKCYIPHMFKVDDKRPNYSVAIL